MSSKNVKYLGLQMVYETFSKQYSEEMMFSILENNPADLPKGFDLF